MADADDDTQAQDQQAQDTQDAQFQTNNPTDTNPITDMQQDEQLPEDNDTPFSPPDGVQDRLDNTHQLTDNNSNIDEHEHYDAGLEQATGADLPGQAADEDQADAPPEQEPDA